MGRANTEIPEVLNKMNRKPVVQNLKHFDGRTIAISDIHGSLDTYRKLLAKVDYNPDEDRLILVGDMIEKGSQNLETLRFIMKQAREEKEFYALMGNNDFVAKNVLLSYRLDFLKSVLLARKASLIHEMIAESGLPPLTEDTDMDQLCYELRKRYLTELSFLNDLPHVISTPSVIFAHSGILNEETYADDYKDVMARFQFEREDHHFNRMVVVGHMPVSEYCTSYPEFNPRYDHEKNIYSIDGGNVLKKAGQLNALILRRNVMRTANTDLLPKVRVLHSTHPDNQGSFFINHTNSEVEILEKGEHKSLVCSEYLHRRVYVDNDFIINGRASNYTNFELPLQAGHTVHLVNIWGKRAQVKHRGVMGWTDLSNLSYDPILEEDEFDMS